MSDDNAFVLNTFLIVPAVKMAFLSDVHNSGDDVLLCGDCDVHEDQKSKECNNSVSVDKSFVL